MTGKWISKTCLPGLPSGPALLALLVALVPADTLAQRIYACDDENGNPVYGDTPCEEGESRELRLNETRELEGPRYRYRSEIPAGLTDSVAHDPYHVPGALAAGILEGADVLPGILAYTGAADLDSALDLFEAWGLDNIANRAVMLRILQFALD